MANDFTIDQVRKFWDGVADIYDEVNKKIGPVHYQRFIESIKYLNLKNGDKVLNIWSRTGNAIPYLKNVEGVEIYNLEVSPKMMARAKEKFPAENFILTDLKILNFPDNFFDAILLLETLEHTPEPLSLLKELKRVLKPSGRLVMSLPPKTAEIPLKIYEVFFKNHGEGPHNFLSSKTVKKMLTEVNFNLIFHKGTLLFPVGPEFLQRFAEKIIELFQRTPLKEIGIRQFYVCSK